jgi:hypothetical protein
VTITGTNFGSSLGTGTDARCNEDWEIGKGWNASNLSSDLHETLTMAVPSGRRKLDRFLRY